MSETKMQHTKLAILCFIFLSIAGCFSPIHLPQKNSYTLNPGPFNVQQSHHSSKTLLVMNTESNDELDTKKIAYVNRPYQLAYFTKNNWITTPADQLNALITNTLQQSNYFKAVVATPFVGVTDLKLNTYLYKLQQNFLFNPSREQIVLAAQLVNASSGKLVAARTFSYEIPTNNNNPFGGVVAANKAVRQMLQQLVVFVIRNS